MEPPHPPPPPDDSWARIPARTEKRALDWSLVLASQEISAVIENHPDAGWTLRVPADQHSRARAHLELYLRENRRWPWQRTLGQQELVFDWGAFLWLLLTMVAFQMQQSFDLVRMAGVMDTTALRHGQWWRLFTAEFLHTDLLHLATNSVFGMILLGFAMGRYGTGPGLLAAFLAGTGGNIVSWLADRGDHVSLGASGVVMGALGLLAAQSIGDIRTHPRGWRFALGGLAGGLMLFVLLGLNPGSDVAAHLGGFVSGTILGTILVCFPALPRQPTANLIALILFSWLTIWPWVLAIKAAN